MSMSEKHALWARNPAGHPMSRREMVRQFGLAAAAVGLGGCALETRAAAAKKALDMKYGLELYTVDKAMKADFEGTLHQVAKIGYERVEFPWFYGRDATQVRQALDAAGLICESALYYPTAFVAQLNQSDRSFEQGLPELIEDATVIGIKHMGAVLFPLRPGLNLQGLTADDYKNAANFLNQVGQETQKHGIQLTYHNHNFEFTEVDGRTGFDILMEEFAPELVKIEVDAGWIVQIGKDPMEYFEKYAGRFISMHVRDYQPGPGGGSGLSMPTIPIGSGTIDWETLLPAAQKAGVEAGYVEQDPAEPAESFRIAAASLDYLTKTFG